jgi:hypothetical protein
VTRKVLFTSAKDPTTGSPWQVYTNGDMKRPCDGYWIAADDLNDKRGSEFYDWPLHMNEKGVDFEIFVSAWLLALTVAKATVDWDIVLKTLDHVRSNPENTPEFKKIYDEECAKLAKDNGPGAFKTYSPFDLINAHNAARKRWRAKP